MRLRFCLIVVASLSAAPVLAESIATLPSSKIDAIFTEFDRPNSPGCALGIMQNGKLTYARGYGMANLEHDVPNGPAIVYDIGSTSKQFTAASILLLEQRGKLTLDDDVRKYVPELPAYQHTITLRHLLHHTGGLRDYLGLFSLAGMNFEDTTTEQDALAAIVRQTDVNFAPGTQYLYSNSGYLLLSIIVQRVSDMSFPDFVRTNIFEPLGMKHSLVLNDHRRIVPKRATGYSANPNGSFRISMSNFEQTGDGAVLSSIEDLARWDANFYSPVVGDHEFLTRMHVAGKLSSGDSLEYAAGLQVDEYRGLRRVSHGGAWAGYRADLVRFPDQRLTIACLCNVGRASPSELALRVADIMLEESFPRSGAATTQMDRRWRAIDLTESQLQQVAGVYRSAITGELRRITLTQRRLKLDSFSSQSRELVPQASARFEVVDSPGLIVELDAGNGKQLRITRPNAKAQVFERVATFQPTRSQLDEFSGRYFSEELDAYYVFSVEHDQLLVANPDGVKRPLVPTIADSFAVLSGPQLEFQRDATGKITGLIVSAGRIRGVRFSK